MSAKKKVEEVSVEFGIQNIEILEKSFRVTQLIENKAPETQYELSFDIRVDEINKFIIDMLQVKIKTNHDEFVVGSLTLSCTFLITNFLEIVKKNSQNTMTIPDSLIETLNIITIGTARGIIFNEFKGTWLHKNILPIIDPKSFKPN